MYCKLLFIRLSYFSTFKTHNHTNSNNLYIYEYFSIQKRQGRGKNIKYTTLTATHNTATNNYHFDNLRFQSMDKMLDYILLL